MFRLKRLTVTNKLNLLTIIAVLGLVVYGAFSFATLQRVKVNGPLYTHIAQGQALVSDVVPSRGFIAESYLAVLQLASEEDSARQDQLYRRCELLEADYGNRHARWSRELEDGELKQWLVVTSYEPARKFYHVVNEQFIPAIKQGNRDLANEFAHGKLKELFDEHHQAIKQVVTLAQTRNTHDEQRAQATVVFSNWLLVGTGIGITALVLAMSSFINRSVRHALAKVEKVASSLSNVSRSLSDTSVQLALNTHKQAASLEETAASLEEITATVDQNAENADQANGVALRSRHTAEQGGEVVGRAVQAMRDIEVSSKKISDIISAIDELAFQTNLLALNAAVEAARAGEQGRGFAVVAGEVRNLAQRSAAAAKEIKVLIEDSVEKVETGSSLVNQSGEKLNEITAAVQQVTNIVGEIAGACREQSVAIEQVSRAVSQIDHATQVSATQSDSMSRSAVGLAEQSQQLQSVLASLHHSRDLEDEFFTHSLKPAEAVSRRATEANWSAESDRELDSIPVGSRDSRGGFEDF
ncbi:MAG: methyl-accepting chemotaxis protein [Planctomycetota bacterium]|nr:methyl-accepting chemotaxis protein [Planctomycetota bacterium]